MSSFIVGTEPELPYHVPGTFKVGMKVRVVAALDAAHAWYNEPSPWTAEAVGQVVKIQSEDFLRGYLCGTLSLKSFYLPSCALENCNRQSGPCVIEVPSV